MAPLLLQTGLIVLALAQTPLSDSGVYKLTGRPLMKRTHLLHPRLRAESFVHHMANQDFRLLCRRVPFHRVHYEISHGLHQSQGIVTARVGMQGLLRALLVDKCLRALLGVRFALTFKFLGALRICKDTD